MQVVEFILTLCLIISQTTTVLSFTVPPRRSDYATKRMKRSKKANYGSNKIRHEESRLVSYSPLHSTSEPSIVTSCDHTAVDCPSLNILLEISKKISKGNESNDTDDRISMMQTVQEATKLLETLIGKAQIVDKEQEVLLHKNGNVEPPRPLQEVDELILILAQNGLEAANMLRKLMLQYGPTKGKGRKTLLSTISFMIDEQSPSKTLAVTMLVAALALKNEQNIDDHDDDDDDDKHRSASRSAMSGLLPNGRYKAQINQESSQQSNASDSTCFLFGEIAVHSLISAVIADSKIMVDLHIVTFLARALVSDKSQLISPCAACIRYTLGLDDQQTSNETNNIAMKNPEIEIMKGSFGLAAELQPFSEISPVTLVKLALEHRLWHGAERICESAIHSKSHESHDAVHALIDGSSERHMYRQSDTLATTFYENGGMSRYAEARYVHALETISKVILKRQFPIIERQIERVDKAQERVALDNNDDNDEFKDNNYSQEVRLYALSKLREVNEHENAHRLARLWKMDYWYDENDSQKFIQARLDKYIQWKDAFPEDVSNIPDVISNPNELIQCFNEMIQTVDNTFPIIGFDVEWGDTSGAALLQLSSYKKAILIDVPALLKSPSGCSAFQKTAGALFAGRVVKASPVLAAGFSCKEDISRLRASVGVDSSHWFTSTESLLDIKPIIAKDKEQLKGLGLSRVCEYFLGKPLDKAEQVSMWLRRPLSQSQRVYAALDAWACVAICSKLPISAILKVNGDVK